MSENIVSMNIDKNLIKPIVEAQIKQAILDNMGDIKEYMQKLIEIALNEKCDIYGNTNCSSYDKKHTYIDVLLNNAIRKSAQEAIQEFMVQESKTFKKAFKNYLKQTTTLNHLFDTFVNFADKTMVEALEQGAVQGYLQKQAHAKSLNDENEAAKQRLRANAQNPNAAENNARIFTREQIGKMSGAEFAKNERAIMEQLRKGLIRRGNVQNTITIRDSSSPL